jgi:TRAP-type mannitol/chloroaromatic compound transport system substrate-binding protein
VEVIQWSDEDLRNVRMVSREIWDEFSKKSPMTKKVLDSQKAWLKELGLID